MELPIIIFILLFFLVIILLLLHRSNKKHADKISVLEQTLDMKVDAITSLKETYAASRRALDEHAVQANEIADKKQKIQKLQENKASLKATIIEKNAEIEKHHERHAKSAETTRQTIAKFNTEAQAQVRVMDGLKHLHKEEIREADKKKLALEDTINSKTTKNRELSSLLTQTIIEKKEEKKRLDTIIGDNNEAIKVLKRDYAKSQEIAKRNYEQYEAKLVAKDEEMAKLNTVFNELVEELQEDISRLEENVANKTQTIKELEARYAQTVQNYEENISGLKEEIAVQNKKIEELITEHKVAEKDALRKREILEQNIVLFKENIQNLEANVASKKQTIQTLETQYKQTVEKYDANIVLLKKDIVTAHSKIETLIAEHTTQVEAYELQHAKNKKTIKEKLKVISGLEKDNANQVIRINKLEEDKVLKKHAYDSLEATFKASEKEAEKQRLILENNIQILQENIGSLESNVVILKENVTTKKETIKALEVQYKQTVKRYDDNIILLKEEIVVSNTKIETLKLEHTKSIQKHKLQQAQNKKIIQDKVEIIGLLEKDNANHIVKINGLEEDKVLKKHEYIQLQKEYKQAEVKSTEKIQILGNTITHKIEELKKQGRVLEQTRLAYENEHDTLAATLINHAREMRTLEEKAKRSYEISVAKYTEYDRELAKTIEIKEQLEIDKNRQIVALNKTMLETQQALAFLQKSQEDKALQNEHEIVQLSQQVKAKEEQERHVLLSYANEKQELTGRISNLKKQLLAKEQNIYTLTEAYEKKVQAFEIDKDDLENIIIEKEKIIQIKDKTIVELDQTYEGIIQKVTEGKNTLTKQLSGQNSQVIKIEKKQPIKKDILSELKTEKENMETLSTHDEVMRAIHAGEAKGRVSKKLGIPIKRIELIIKFDKMQQKGHNVS